MINKPLVSIIIPVYNSESFLSKCLESVINQTYQNIEIILINDGSQDNSLEICHNFARKDKRIKFFSQENQGNSIARNKGIKLAQGDYIFFVDSDDFLEPDYVEMLLYACIDNNVLLSICNVFIFHSTIDIKIINDIQHSIKECLNPLQYNKEYHIMPVRKCYHKSLLKKIQFPVGLYHEDIGFWFGIMSIIDNISLVNKPLYYYRKNNFSSITMSNIKPERRCFDGLKSFEYGLYLIEKYAPQQQLPKLINALVGTYYNLPFTIDNEAWLKEQHKFILKIKKYHKYLNYQNKMKLFGIYSLNFMKLKKHLFRYINFITNSYKLIIEPVAIIRYALGVLKDCLCYLCIDFYEKK